MKSLSRIIQRNTLYDLFMLTGFWLAHAINNAVWLRLDRYPPGWDSAHHLTMTLRWLHFWQAPSLVHFKEVAAASSYPPLPYHIVIPFYLLFGQDADVATLASSTLWLGLLMFSTYGLGREIHSRKSGLVAAILVSLYPIIVALEREFYLDLALTAAVTFALWMLVRCGHFDHRRRAVALGLALGLGTLIKWPFSFFLAGPILAAILLITHRRKWSRTRLINLGISLAIMGTIASAQYLFNYFFLPKNLYNFENIKQLVKGFAGAAGHPPWYTFNGLIYYGTALVNDQISFLFALLFIVSIPPFLKAGKRGRLVMIVGIAIPYLLATLLPLKEQRITMPYLPFIALVSAIGLTSIQRPLFRNALLILIFCLGITQYWANSYGIPFIPQELAVRNAWIELYIFDQHLVRSPRDYQMQPGRWWHVEILDVILLDSIAHEVPLPTQVPLVANTATYNPNTFNYYSFQEGLKIDFLYVWSWYDSALDLESHPFTYLVIKSAANTDMEAWDKEGIERAQTYLRTHQDEFSKIFRASLPDNTEVYVYRRKNFGIGAQ